MEICFDPSKKRMAYLKRVSDSAISLSVHAKPGSKFSQIVDASGPLLEVQIAARAVEGAANVELVDFLSGVLKVKRRQVSIVSGDKSRDKILQVSGIDADYALDRLLAECEISCEFPELRLLVLFLLDESVYFGTTEKI